MLYWCPQCKNLSADADESPGGPCADCAVILTRVGCVNDPAVAELVRFAREVVVYLEEWCRADDMTLTDVPAYVKQGTAALSAFTDKQEAGR